MKKSQATIEFLMTYGWAILVVLCVIGALAYFGVLNPRPFLRCEGISWDEAEQIVIDECQEDIKPYGKSQCNTDTHTWWIDIDLEQEGCNPACVINTQDRTAEINYRCTGGIPP